MSSNIRDSRERQLEDWARDWYERAINGFDLTVIDEKCSDTMACSNSTLWEVAGVQGNRDSYTRLHTALPDAHCDIDEVFVKSNPVSGDKVTVWFTISGTHTGPLTLPSGEVLEATGRRISSSNVAMIRLEDWKMVAVRSSSDFLVQFGVLPYEERRVG